MREADYVGLDGLRELRQKLRSGDEIMARVELSFAELLQDNQAREHFDPQILAGAALAEEAGLTVYVDLLLADNMDIEGELWRVEVPEGFGEQIQALVWDEQFHGGLGLGATLTRSTRGPFWQLTRWASDGGPWGHVDLETVPEAFDSSPMASGFTVGRLRQVVFRDGRVLTREGTTALNPPNARLKRKLMR